MYVSCNDYACFARAASCTSSLLSLSSDPALGAKVKRDFIPFVLTGRRLLSLFRPARKLSSGNGGAGELLALAGAPLFFNGSPEDTCSPPVPSGAPSSAAIAHASPPPLTETGALTAAGAARRGREPGPAARRRRYRLPGGTPGRDPVYGAAYPPSPSTGTGIP